jgi:hypothetical protein
MSASDQPQTPSLEQLLDLHLGQLPIEEHAVLERRVAEHPALARQSDRVANTLKLLDHYRVPPAGERLVQATLQRVARARQADQLVYHPAPEPAPEPAVAAAGRREWFFSLRDLVAVAASIVLVLGILSPMISRGRALAHRSICANRLASLGQGLGSYAQSYEGRLPVAAASAMSPSASQAGQTVAAPSPRQRAHLFALLKTRHVSRPQDFVCPANRQGQPMVIRITPNQVNFVSRTNCNYSYQDPSGSRLTAEGNPQFPVLADENPYLQPAARLVGSWPGDNSLNHPGAPGQNVLRLDGSVRWQKSPWCGTSSHDNIWQQGLWTQVESFDAPADGPDAYLFP